MNRLLDAAAGLLAVSPSLCIMKCVNYCRWALVLRLMAGSGAEWEHGAPVPPRPSAAQQTAPSRQCNLQLRVYPVT